MRELMNSFGSSYTWGKGEENTLCKGKLLIISFKILKGLCNLLKKLECFVLIKEPI